MNDHRHLERVNDNSLYKALGIKLTAFGGGSAKSELDAPLPVQWPFEGQPHGGILFTQVDTTLATAMLPDLSGRYSCATIGLDIQFTQRAQYGPFVCHGWTTHRGGKIGFGNAETRDARGEIVVVAQGTFRLIDRTSD